MFWRLATIMPFCVLLANALTAQVFADHNLPSLLPTGEQIEAEIIIHKPATREFVQYELAFQPGIAVSEIDVAGGTFKSEDNKVRVMWSISPETPEIKMRLALLAGTAGTYTLNHRIEYAHEGQKHVALLQDVVVRAKAGAAVSDRTLYSRVNQVVPAQLPPTRIDSMENKLRDPAKAAIHVAQLRKDAHEARKVGENELKQASLELSEAKKELEKSGRITNEEQRKKRVAEAEQRVQKAETNKQIAQKILVLAKTLEENANQIESARRADSAAGKTQSEKDVNSLKTLFAEVEKDKKAAGIPDTLYHIQIGAFAHHPGKSPYSALGTVKIVSEDGLYKVLLGSFSARDQASQLQRQLATQGLEGFIVKYYGDRRVK